MVTDGAPSATGPTESPVPLTDPSTASGIGPLQVMQVHDCYLVFETADGITVIDQHALHERVMYEYLRNRVADGAVESQRMLVPLTLEFSDREAVLLLEHASVFEQIDRTDKNVHAFITLCRDRALEEATSHVTST